MLYTTPCRNSWVLVSFPDCSRLQFSIACSIQKQRRDLDRYTMMWHNKGRQTGRERCPMKNLLYYLVQGLKAIAFKRNCQYNLLFGRFKADKCKVCVLQWSGTTTLSPTPYPVCLPESSHVTKSPRPSLSVLAHCSWSKTELGKTRDEVKSVHGCIQWAWVTHYCYWAWTI